MNAVTMHRCPGCRSLFLDRDKAKKCCPVTVREVHVCGHCQEEHFLIIDAGQCCRQELFKKSGGSFGSVRGIR